MKIKYLLLLQLLTFCICASAAPKIDFALSCINPEEQNSNVRPTLVVVYGNTGLSVEPGMEKVYKLKRTSSNANYYFFEAEVPFDYGHDPQKWDIDRQSLQLTMTIPQVKISGMLLGPYANKYQCTPIDDSKRSAAYDFVQDFYKKIVQEHNNSLQPSRNTKDNKI